MTNKKKQVEEGSNLRVFISPKKKKNLRVFVFAFEDNLKCTVNHIGVALEANCNLETVKKKNLVLGLGQWTSNLAYWDGGMKSKVGK